MGEAPPSRYDYGILLDYDSSGTISRNLLEHFSEPPTVADQSNCYGPENLPSRTINMTPCTTFLTGGVDSALDVQPILLAACDPDKNFML